jgi:quinoprotein glucose dehydrogenase
MHEMRHTARAAGLAALALTFLGGGAVLAGPGDWPGFGNDPSQTKYSPLGQITPANVTNLKRAWTYDTGDPSVNARGWEISPIVVNDIMYFPTSGGKIIALNADTGQEVWKVDLKLVAGLPANPGSSRWGVSYWPGDGKAAPRIVVAVNDGHMLQLDAKTGALYKKFGNNGVVDLKIGVMEKFGGEYRPGQPPAIYKNIAIITAVSGENGRYGVPGDPRGFDLNTGKQLWRFHTVPQPGEANFGGWGVNGWKDRRGPGSWVPIAVDNATGTVFIALGQPTDQDYGISRPGNNEYSSSVIALDAVTGKLKWFFQTTHHDLFDYDVNAPPTLLDIRKDGKVIPAVAQTTKAGLLWLLDRNTGKPIFGYEERPVPHADAPGEVASPTQPFPLKPVPIARLSLTREELSTLSPAATKACQALYDGAVQEGPYTPHLMVQSLLFPSNEGGGSWGGATFDPNLRYIFVNTRSVGTRAILQPYRSSNALDSYAKRLMPFDGPEGYPCSIPPWGEIMAINADTADVVWRVPLGEYKELTARGIPKTGAPNAGGSIATAGGVLFVGATTDRTFRAFDERTGKELWSDELPNNSIATPMTYRGNNGKQYVATEFGAGLNVFNHPMPQPGTNQIVVYALP